MGTAITFYSYKGGVGRSMALANIGVILANWGKKTLLIDWDLEAPGLENYFNTLIPSDYGITNKDGLIDLLALRAENAGYDTRSIQWEKYLTSIPIPSPIPGARPNSNLYLLTSGKKDDGYISRVKQFDFSNFYNEKDGGEFLEDLRDNWKKKFDYILIDSRTGLTDSSGICSIHMPDIVVALFTATEQGFKGTLNAVNTAKSRQAELVYDRLKLKVLPIPTRLDNSELRLTEEWLVKFANDLTDIYKDFITLDKDENLTIQPLEVLKKTKIPYISFYGYGEKLSILEQGSDDPNSLGYAYETIAAILVNNFQDVAKLKDDRDGYIKIARGEEVMDYSYFQKKIAAEQEEKKKLEELLRFRETEQLQKELRLQNQLKNSRLITYAIAGILVLAVIIYFVVFNPKNRTSSDDFTNKSDSTVAAKDSSKPIMDTTVKILDSTKK